MTEDTTTQRTLVNALGALHTAARSANGGRPFTAEESHAMAAAARSQVLATKPAPEESRHTGQVFIAQVLGVNYAHELMHVRGDGWYHYDGRRWCRDQHGHPTRLVLEAIRGLKHKSVDNNDPTLMKWAERAESAAGIRGVLEIAEADPALAATVEDLDADPYLVNCANGTYDTRTSQLHPHDPADRITKITNAAYDPHAPGATWEAFLARVLPDDGVRGFLQRYTGLALIGRVLEHILAILVGQGRNGKGVYYGAILAAFGDYAATAEPDLFMQRENAHPTGVMDLRARRLVVVSENEKNRHIAEANLKRFTGGDTLKARYMRQDFVEFTPSHTAMLVTNHLPRVSGDDPAIWARLRVVPFDVVIPKQEQDPTLADKLAVELDAILSWALAGLRDYQAGGLNEPEAVLQATEHYKADSDVVGRFIEECCDIGAGHSALTERIYQEWQTWAHQEGAQPIGKKAFGQILEQRGYRIKRGTGGIRSRQGISIKLPPEWVETLGWNND